MASEALIKEAIVDKKNISEALKQVESIQNGKLPKKSARDFLKESRKSQ